MKLDVIIDSKTLRITVPQNMLDEGEEFFQKMDRDMDGGWQMGPEFVESPDPAQRCQIAANKLLVSVSAQNELLVQLMAAYILRRLPDIKAVEIDTAGEMLNTELVFEEPARALAINPTARDGGSAGREAVPTGTNAGAVFRPKSGLNKADARARAETDVSQVYKVGKAYRFATYDHASGRWLESPFAASEDEAKQQRDAACVRLAEKLAHG
jgi:hypothetical protein